MGRESKSTRSEELTQEIFADPHSAIANPSGTQEPLVERGLGSELPASTHEPGHDAWVAGRERTVLIQFDAAAETAQRFGLPSERRH